MPKRTVRGLLIDSGDTVREVAAYLHITPEVMSRKLNGKSQWKQNEIKLLILRYHLSADEAMEIFFDIVAATPHDQEEDS